MSKADYFVSQYDCQASRLQQTHIEGIRWMFEAELWLKDIYDYISLDNPQATEQVIDGIGSPCDN